MLSVTDYSFFFYVGLLCIAAEKIAQHKGLFFLNPAQSAALTVATSITVSFPLICCSDGPKPVPSRMFAGPDEYPPEIFKAYGILAFRSHATNFDRSRYEMICNAYVSSLLNVNEVIPPKSEQMVTIWPLDKNDRSRLLKNKSRDKLCIDAVEYYGLHAAQTAIALAKLNGANLSGQGPFLLAWSPGTSMGRPDSLVLVSDMSDVANNEQAKQVFYQWAEDIQSKPELWENGWNVEKLKFVVRLWSDKWGTKILEILSNKG